MTKMGNGRLKQVVDDAVRGEIYRALSTTEGNVKLAAANLGINRTYAYTLMRRLGIQVERRKVASVVQKKPS